MNHTYFVCLRQGAGRLWAEFARSISPGGSGGGRGQIGCVSYSEGLQRLPDCNPTSRLVTAVPLLRTYLVEDSPVIRDNLIAALQELAPLNVLGFSPDEAGALNWLKAPGHPIDLLIVDLFLAGGSGLGVLRGARGLPAIGRMVVLSNYATADMRAHCDFLGADRVFDKSTEIDALVEYCNQLAREQAAPLPS